MKTIALRFGETFSPKCGTISAHKEYIDRIGYVWYGKMGTRVSNEIIQDILKSKKPRILLINSGKANRYWAYISEVGFDCPKSNEYPSYYGDMSEKMKTWFKITAFEEAPKDILSKCIVTSSGSTLSEASKYSMSPYFKISYDEGE